MPKRSFATYLPAALVALLTLAALLVPRDVPTTYAQSDARCFPETSFCISGRIRQFYEQNGDVPVFGYPLGALGPVTNADGQTFQAQWFERQRLELHPENAAPYDVELGRLGVDQLAQEGRDWFTFPKADPSSGAQAGCSYFAQTGHSVCGAFLSYWQSHGLTFPGVSGISTAESLALFGFPVSEPAMETNSSGQTVLTQWFERARFEYLPTNPDPYKVLLGRLGAEVLAGSSGSTPALAPVSAPAASPAYVVPATVQSFNVDVHGQSDARVTLDVQGVLGDSCTTLGSIDQQINGQQITVTVYVNHASAQPNGQPCALVSTPFDTSFDLNWRLGADWYDIAVNGIGQSFRVYNQNWGGTWHCFIESGNCISMDLVEQGDHVVGTFGVNGAGSLNGTISGNTLTGNWSISTLSGTFSFSRDADARTFVGSRQPGPKSWCGWREGEGEPVACRNEPAAPPPTTVPGQGPAYIAPAHVQSVEAIVNSQGIASVTLHVQGVLGDSCTTLGAIHQQINGQQINVRIDVDHTSLQPNGQTCVLNPRPFETSFDLNTRLHAGQYDLHVNGINQSFRVR